MSLRNADAEKLVGIWFALNGKGNMFMATFSDFLEFELLMWSKVRRKRERERMAKYLA
jgi:hypothetical protein